jgi:hypothetical protein
MSDIQRAGNIPTPRTAPAPESQPSATEDQQEQLALLKASIEKIRAGEASVLAKPSPEALISGNAASDAGAESAGLSAYVDGFIRQMLVDGLKKAGQQNTEGW